MSSVSKAATAVQGGDMSEQSRELLERPVETREAGGSNPSQRATLDNAGLTQPMLYPAQAAQQGLVRERVFDSPPRTSLPIRMRPKIRPFQIRWRESLGWDDCPYAHRTTLNLGLFSIRFHEWHRSDDKRNMHDHPWHFVTLVIRGSYVDVSEAGRDQLRLGSIRFRHATHRHYVEVPPGGAWTLLLTTPKIREWGFWVQGIFRRPLKYFHKWHHPPCDEQ